eukprot:s58_g39.t1
MGENTKQDSLVKRFSGDGLEPQRDYKLWKRWSKAYLAVQKAKGTDKSVFGALLFTLLDGTALRAFDSVSTDDLEQIGGQDLVYQVLDERFPEEAVHDRLGEVLDKVFELRVEKGEATSSYTGKARAAFSAAEAEGVKLPSVARGYLLLRFAKLTHEKKAVVMAAARQSYEEKDVAAALRTTYPEGLYSGRQGAHVNAVDYEPDAENADEFNEVFLAEDEDGTLDDESEPIEEQDAIDVLMTWKQTRQSINKEKLSRGLGTSQGFKKLEARVKCFKCQRVGHFSRNCPMKKGKGGGGKGDQSTGSSKVSFVNMVEDVSDGSFELVEGDWDAEVSSVMRTWNTKPKDGWIVEGNEVVRHHVIPRSSMFSPARTGCPVPLNQLSTARTTIMIHPDGRQEEQFTANWKNGLEAHRKTDAQWTGKSVFYRLVGHEVEENLESEVDALAAAFHEAREAASVLGDKGDVVTNDQVPANVQPPEEIFVEPESSDEDQEPAEGGSNTLLVHDAGYGIVDTGCGRGLVGALTLERHAALLKAKGYDVTELPPKVHTFRYGNGSSDQTGRRVELPVFVGGKELRLRLHVVPGNVPLLLSKRLLKSLGAMIDLNANKLVMTRAGISTDLLEMKDNSYQINLMETQLPDKVSTAEVDVLTTSQEKDEFTPEELHEIMMCYEPPPESDDGEDGYPPWDGVWCVFKAQERKLVQRNLTQVLSAQRLEAPSMVEIFSPGRFSALAPQCGLVARGSFDLSSGWNWCDVQHRKQAEAAIQLIEPDFALMSPPCGPLSPLQNLTSDVKRVDVVGFEKEVKVAKGMVRWCIGVAEFQLRRNKSYVFESSKGSGAWKTQEMELFISKTNPYIIDVPACAVGLADPESHLLFGKQWRFMTDCATVAAALGRLQCDGTHEHRRVEGASGGMMRSVRTQVYPQRLLKVILGACAQHELQESLCFAVSQASVQGEIPLKGEHRQKVERALRKLHVNLGHASRADMERILRHHHAQESVLEMVRGFECSVCQSRAAPKAVKESAPPRDIGPLRYVGLDVKFLPSWKKDEKIKALNIVCRMSGLQQMYPFREQENSDVIGRMYRQWTRAYGRPRYLKFDASRCNLGQHFLDILERDGTTPLDIPGEAHEQIGDVESQGWHFEEAFRRVLDEMCPQDYNQWLECVDVTTEARNSLLRRAGHSPYQLVFGRDPEFPGDDLCSERPNPISNSAILEDAVAEYQHRARSVARQEMLRQLDHRAARIALNSRPRPLREFRAGDEVAIWRRGKGIKKSSARWRGPGIVAGAAGGNYWVSMPGAFVKCSPEQLRLRTTEEREADRFLVRDLRAAAAALWPEVGVSNRPHQKFYFDITAESVPPGDLSNVGPQEVPDCRPDVERPETTAPMDASAEGAQSKSVGQSDGSQRSRSHGHDNQEVQSIKSSDKSLSERLSQLTADERASWPASVQQADRLDGMPRRDPPNQADENPEKRARVEQRVAGQVFPPSLPSPVPAASVPIPISSESSAGTSSSSVSSSSSSQAMVVNEVTKVNLVRDSGGQAVSMSSIEDTGEGEDFVLCCDDEDNVLLAGGRNEINLKESKWKSAEWQDKLLTGVKKEMHTVIDDKQALRPLTVEQSRKIRQTMSDRIVPSRLVLVEKLGEDGQSVVKARWTARGDKDPDLLALIRQGSTQSPTISSNGRYTVLQTIASHQFEMQLGDVTGAFLEGDELERPAGKLFMAPPRNFDLPGYDSEQLFEVIKPIYGFNDSPQRWFTKFDKTVKRDKWKQSQLDHCIYFLWDQGRLCGVLGVHVDDVILGGSFCGEAAKPKLRSRESPLVEVTAEEASSLKSVLGGALWLARETRPDLAVQVSQGQQLLPRPTLGAARTVGNVVRRAKQYKHLCWKILPIPVQELRLCLHTDAAFANAKKQGTQAGYLVGATTDDLQAGRPAPWSPCVWKSYRLKRVVGSTFAGESQVLSDGLGHAEWLACHLAEAKYENFSLSDRKDVLSEFKLQAIVDCKSIYDHLQTFSSPGSVGDKRVAIDLVIVRETLQRIGGVVRWAPTWLQLADALTKETAEATDLLRAAMTTNKYHLNNESTMMEAAAIQRQLRLSRKSPESMSGDAQRADSSEVRFVQCFRDSMVKVAVENISEEEIRSLMEYMVSGWVKDSEEFLSNI